MRNAPAIRRLLLRIQLCGNAGTRRCFDYEGIEKWASGEWKANKALTKFYSGYIAAAKNVIKIEFEHVKAHTGIDGNEEADRLAKEAVGL